MGDLSVQRWRRFGHDRWYVNGADGTSLGWMDATTGDLHLEHEAHRAEVVTALAAHPEASALVQAPNPPPPSAAPPPEVEPWAVRVTHRDLGSREAGAEVAKQAAALRQEAPVRTLVSRVLGVHTDERAWRVGAVGERKVAKRLERLPDGWHVLHAMVDRRDEMAFELPLDRAGGRPATVGDVVELLREHLPATDPLAGYPDAVPAPLLDRPLRGFLGGFIDLVVRRPGPEGDVFHVIDHKTNRLGVWGEPLTAYDYRQDALGDAMAHGHYPVQALLYAVAAHRMLRWRLGDAYDPAANLGSVLYLFLRGMAGPDTPAPDGRPCGVFAWSLPTSLITATSDLLHGVPA